MNRMLCEPHRFTAHRNTSKSNNSQNLQIGIRDACATREEDDRAGNSTVELEQAMWLGFLSRF